ncbi:MAG: hypothetical protein LWX09_04820 [Bacteroidia bacterium]|nr:hypothetical protein [Bacteroidia bacterium]
MIYNTEIQYNSNIYLSFKQIFGKINHTLQIILGNFEFATGLTYTTMVVLPGDRSENRIFSGGATVKNSFGTLLDCPLPYWVEAYCIVAAQNSMISWQTFSQKEKTAQNFAQNTLWHGKHLV